MSPDTEKGIGAIKSPDVSSEEVNLQEFLGFFQQTEEIVFANSGLDEEAYKHATRDREVAKDAGVSIDLPFLLDGMPFTVKFGGYPWSSSVFNKSIEVNKRSDTQHQPSFQINIFYEYEDNEKKIDEVDIVVDGEHIEVSEFFDKGSKSMPEFFSRIELDRAA